MAKTITFRNWNHSATSTPRVVAVPKNLEELIDVVRIDAGLVNGDAYVDCENVIELTTS